MGTISEVVLQEMKATFKMIKKAVARIEGDFWKQDEKDWMYGYILFHIIETIEFYNSNSEEEWQPMNDVSQDSRSKETATLITKDKSFFEKHVADVETQTFDILQSFSEADFLEEDGFAPRGFTSRLHKYNYVMRHCMFHLGELTKMLRNHDRERIGWE